MSARRSAVRVAAGLAALALVVGGCAEGSILANPAVIRPEPPRPTGGPPQAVDPQPVVVPRDDGSHARLTEWWYYTGHLREPGGRRFGFEFVVFRAERGNLPVSWASHVALTDESGGTFTYAERSEIGPQVDLAPRDPAGEPAGFDLAISGVGPADPVTKARSPWTMTGGGGRDRVRAAAAPDEAKSGASSAPGEGQFGLDLTLATDRSIALHNTIGYLDFGPAGGSYYYSRTRLDAAGSITLAGRTLPVEGTAWFDHQWGDFISVGGGWDWFAVNLNDGTDLTLSLVRAPDGSPALAYGTIVGVDGATRHLEAAEFTVTVTAQWVSERTGARYPAGWRIVVPGERLTIDLAPTVADQELDTRATTGVVYWEGSQLVRAVRDGTPLDGTAYVELTGYLGPPTASTRR